MRMLFIIIVWLLVPLPLVLAQENTQGPVGGMHRQPLTGQLVRWGLPEEMAGDVLAGMEAAHFGEKDVRVVADQFRLVQGDRLAMAAMLDKIHEGVAKRVPPETIVRALIRVRERQALAAQTTDRLVRKHEGAALRPIVADALVSGLEPQELGMVEQGLLSRKEYLDETQLSRLTMETMSTVRDMVRFGVCSSTAAAVAAKALGLGYGDEEMHMLDRIVNEQRGQGDMEAVASRILRGMHQGMNVRQLGEAVKGAGGGSAHRGHGDGKSGQGGGSRGHGGGSGHGGGGGGR